MLKCRDVAEQASDYVDNNLSLRHRMAFAFHLLLCGNCRDFIKHVRTSIEYFKVLPDQEISSEQARNIAEQASKADHRNNPE